MVGINKHSRLLVFFITLLLAVYMLKGMIAIAAQPPAFFAVANGALDSLTLTANLSIGSTDIGRNGNVYLAAETRDGWLFNNGVNWILWNNGPLPAYSTGTLTDQSIAVAHNADVSSPAFYTTRVYVGYGLSETDMLENGKYGLIYTIMLPFPCCKQP